MHATCVSWCERPGLTTPTAVQACAQCAPVVLVALEHAHAAVEHAGQPERGVGGRALGVAEAGIEAVRLDVGLVHRVQAERGAEAVEALRVGVVRHAYRVEVGLLHQQDVHHHGLLRDDLQARSR